MRWWDRYRAWQPESQWDRYRAWQLESRTNFVASGVGLRAPIVFLGSLLGLFGDRTAGEALLLTAVFAVLGTLVYGWLWYPRAKAKGQHASVPTRSI